MLTLAIIQARMGSSRLPGKVMKSIGDQPVLWYVIDRVLRAKEVNRLVVATSTSSADDEIALFCGDNGIDCYRGSEEDVLLRYYQAAQNFSADSILRITADCPLVDPSFIDKLVEFFKQNRLDYAGLGDSFPDGFNAEIFTRAALDKAKDKANKKSEREHVTPYMKSQQGGFNYAALECERSPGELGFPHLSRLNNLLLSLDEPYDFKVISEIIMHFYPGNPNFSLFDVLKLIINQGCPEPRVDELGSAVGYMKSLEKDR